ncbi:RagB/SusD family nutrient uptake outer membrane protein [Flavihumibacter solisilvae]|uniref:Starch-binding protein n=1 Tax=Flavihumibacter solisilvae TaxID=1349421 RepID=A0A0C1LLK0_9BACT|nr:RagB/SusD family nutrient uptake outer membrane protein [Flavihumibacter solisilvae]KIC96218.1 hypothetical protein OI18_00115 [Flavihumibacter solisilvae]
MKKNKITILCLLVFLISSCTKYLDQVPAEKLDEPTLFKSKDDVVKVLTQIYSANPDPLDFFGGNLGMCGDEGDFIWSSYDPYRLDMGNYSQTFQVYEKWTEWYKQVRTALYFLGRIDECKDEKLSEQERNWWKGEAEFLLAYYNFLLLRQYGPVPIMTKIYSGPELTEAIAAGIPRPDYNRAVAYIDSLCESAAGKLDITFSYADRVGRANATAAKFLRARLWLYAASPLYNGLTNPATGRQYSELMIHGSDGQDLLNASVDVEKWAKARQAAKEAIEIAATGNYGLMAEPVIGLDAYKRLFTYPRGGEPSRECIFYAQSPSPWEFNQHALPLSWGGYSGICPTLEHANEYFTAKGLLPEDDADWVNATGFYEYSWNDKNISIYNRFRKRDPRFYSNILFPGQYSYAMLTGSNESTGSRWANNSDDNKNWFRSWNDGQDGYANKRGRDYTITGMLTIKWLPRTATSNSLGDNAIPIFRYTELLLNYMEAAFEDDVAKGIDPLGDGDMFFAWDQVRSRVGLPGVKAAYAAAGIPLTVNKLRELIHRERRVELAFEGHRYFDNRRWLDAEREGGPKHGFDIQKSGEEFWNENYVFETRLFNMKNYFLPIPQSEIDKNRQLTQNPMW